MEKIIEDIRKIVKSLFLNENSGHDFYHLERTLNNALTIQEKEGGDRLIIAISSLLHDLHRLIQNQTGNYCSPKDSLTKIYEILRGSTLSTDQIERVLYCIEFHEEYNFSKNGNTKHNLETLILQDADNLDAIGAIGISRTFLFSGAKNIAMWEPMEKNNRDFYEESIQDKSTIHHFYNKLLKLKDNMNTHTGKLIAQRRHQFMLFFLQEFLDEWEGKK